MTMCGKYPLVAAMLLLALLRPLGELLAPALFFPLPRKRSLLGLMRLDSLASTWTSRVKRRSFQWSRMKSNTSGVMGSAPKTCFATL